MGSTDYTFIASFPTRAQREALPPGVKRLKSGRLKRAKPPQPTLLSKTTARRLLYLEQHGLADWFGSRFRVAATHYINKLGERTKLPKGLVHGGV
jgi:hypothetical protein